MRYAHGHGVIFDSAVAWAPAPRPYFHEAVNAVTEPG